MRLAVDLAQGREKILPIPEKTPKTPETPRRSGCKSAGHNRIPRPKIEVICFGSARDPAPNEADGANHLSQFALTAGLIYLDV